MIARTSANLAILPSLIKKPKHNRCCLLALTPFYVLFSSTIIVLTCIFVEIIKSQDTSIVFIKNTLKKRASELKRFPDDFGIFFFCDLLR